MTFSPDFQEMAEKFGKMNTLFILQVSKTQYSGQTPYWHTAQ
jgi:hypothetical protein